MENPRGRVIAIKHVDPSLLALVEVDASVSCARCASGKGCGAGLLGGKTSARRIEALVGPGVDIHEGDEVRIELAPSNLLEAALTVYGLPLAGAVLGAALAYLGGFGDGSAAVAALGGIAAGFAIARLRLRAASCLREFTPTVIERLTVGR